MFWFLSALLLSTAMCWMSEKCFVYDNDFGKMINHQFCEYWLMGNLTAHCVHVADVKLDLASLPAQIDSLCLEAASGLVLHPGSFDRFSKLEQLSIKKCPYIIHSGAFSGLPNLRLISFNKYEEVIPIRECCSTSLFLNAFGQIPNLTKISINAYNISAMPADFSVFTGLKNLKVLRFRSCGTEILDISCRIAELSQSLTSLYIEAYDTVILRSQSCPQLEDASQSKYFKPLNSVRFVFPHLKSLEKCVFKYVPRIYFLSMPLNKVLKMQLLQSGVRKIASFEADLEEGGLGSVCDLVSKFSVESLYLKLETNFSLHNHIGLEGCVGLRELKLTSSFKQGELRFFPFLKTLQVLELDGFFLPQLLDSLCETPDSAAALQKLIINNSPLNKITRQQFYCLRNLSTLDLSNNQISEIEDFAFEGFDKSPVSYLLHTRSLFLPNNQIFNGLEYLDLSHNKMFSINFAAFEGLNSLKVLNLHSNKITRITANHLIVPSGLVSLEKLDMNHNRITYIDDFAFKQMKTLKTLIMDYNNISEISKFTFFGLDRLESLMLENNVVRYFDPFALTHLTSLRKFSVGCLRHLASETAEVEFNLGLLFGRIPVNLTELIINSCSRPMSIMIGSQSAPKPMLHLHIFGQSVRFLDCEKPFFMSVVSLTVIAQELLCGSYFAGKYFKSLESLLLSPQVMSAFVDLVDLNSLLHLRELGLQNVDLSDQPHLAIMLHNLTTLKSLRLYQCRIGSFTEELTRDLKSLKYFVFDLYNDLSVVENFARPLLSLRYMLLINTVLRCSCDNAWFNKWAKYQRQVQVISISDDEAVEFTCRNISNIQNLAKYTESTCLPHVEFVLFASTTLGILLFILVVLVHNLVGDYLLAFMYIARGWVEEAIGKSAKRRYQYDVFVSFAGMDEHWVMDELLPNLERRGPPFLRLCLHSRDFQLGLDIVENITSGLYRSRHTLCLLSHHYLRSKWCSLEMKLATHRLQVEHRDILIIVFLEKISPKLLSAHHRLARIIKRKTYIDWPDELELQTAFWDRLWAKLTPKLE